MVPFDPEVFALLGVHQNPWVDGFSVFDLLSVELFLYTELEVFDGT